jgi:hypothetical protein
MNGAATEPLLDYDRRRYWLSNGWCLRFRVKRCPVTDVRQHGVRYAFTLHDVDMTRLLGFDNAHGIPRRQAYDHRHRFRRVADLMSYTFVGTDELICDCFDEVERVCRLEGVPCIFDVDLIERDEEHDHDDEVTA